MKKLFCVLIALVITFTCTISSFAYETVAQDIDFSEYTIDDLMQMSSNEFSILLNAYERQYNPYNTYGTDRQLTCDDAISTDIGVNLLWTSGNSDLSEQGTHQLITAKACGMMMDEMGFWSSNHTTALLLALSISLASVLPDSDGIISNSLFAGHFYNPNTNMNYAYSTTNTAKTNTIARYNEAKTEYITNGITNDFCEYVGRMVHYIQDANEPHHAANITGINPAHKAFEEFTYNNIDSYLDTMPNVGLGRYRYSITNPVGTIVYDYALVAYDYAICVDNILNKTNWNQTAIYTVRKATEATAILMYKLSYDAGIQLYFS